MGSNTLPALPPTSLGTRQAAACSGCCRELSFREPEVAQGSVHPARIHETVPEHGERSKMTVL